MAFLNLQRKSYNNWTPTSYTSDQTAQVLAVGAGDLLPGWCTVRVSVVFNGSGTDAKIIVGDGGDPNGLMVDGDADETTLGLYVGAGAYHFSAVPRLFTGNDTIDIGFTANTSGSRTTGAINLMVPFYGVDPY